MKRDERPCAVIGPAGVAAPPAWPRAPSGNISPRRTFQENMSRIVIPSPGAAAAAAAAAGAGAGAGAVKDLYDVRYCEGPALVSQHHQHHQPHQPHQPLQTLQPLQPVQPLQPLGQQHVQSHHHLQARIQPRGQQQPQPQPQPQFDPRYVPRTQRYVGQEYPTTAFDYRGQPQPYRPEQYQYVHFQKPPERQTYDCAYPYVQPDKYPQPQSYEYPYRYAEHHRPNPPQIYFREPRERPTTSAPDSQFYRYRFARTPPPTGEIDRRAERGPQPQAPHPAYDPSAQAIPVQFDPYAKMNRQTVYARRPPYAAVVENGPAKMEYYDPYRAAPPDGFQYRTPETVRGPAFFNGACDFAPKQPDCHYANGPYAQRPAYDRTWETTERPKYQYETKYPLHNPLARIPTEFSPNVISPNLSPTVSTKMPFQPQPYRENFVRYEQCSAIVETLQLPRRDRAYEHAYDRTRPSQVGVVESAVLKSQTVIENRTEKPTLDLKHYLENWNEEYEDPKGGESNSIGENPQNNGNAQLYIFDKLVIPEEELVNYKHVQKISKLPDFIKDVTKDPPLGACHILENKTIPPTKIQKGKTLMPIVDLPKAKVPKLDYFADELIDVEAKISQSVIHKEVGCNFEIKPCSPQNGSRAQVPDSLINEKAKSKSEQQEKKSTRLPEKRDLTLNNSPLVPTQKFHNEKNNDKCSINQNKKIDTVDSVLCKNVEVISYSDSMMEYERKINRESRICGSVFSSTNDKIRNSGNKDGLLNKSIENNKIPQQKANTALKNFCNSLPDFDDDINENNINFKEFAHIESVIEEKKKLDEAFPNLSVSNDDHIGVILNMGNANSLSFDDKSILPISEYFDNPIHDSSSEKLTLQEPTFDKISFKTISNEIIESNINSLPINDVEMNSDNVKTSLDLSKNKIENNTEYDFTRVVEDSDENINMESKNVENESVLLINTLIEEKSSNNQSSLKNTGNKVLNSLKIDNNVNFNLPESCNVSENNVLSEFADKNKDIKLEEYSKESDEQSHAKKNDISDHVKMDYKETKRKSKEKVENEIQPNISYNIDLPIKCDLKSSINSLDTVPKDEVLPLKNKNLQGKIFFSKKLNRYEYSTESHEHEKYKNLENLTSPEELHQSIEIQSTNITPAENATEPFNKQEKINVSNDETVIITSHEKNNSLYLIKKESDEESLIHISTNDDINLAKVDLNCNDEKLFEIDTKSENTIMNCKNMFFNKLEEPKIEPKILVDHLKSDEPNNKIMLNLCNEVPILIQSNLSQNMSVSSDLNNEMFVSSDLNNDMSISTDLNNDIDMDDEILNLETSNEMDSIDNGEKMLSDSLEKDHDELYASGKLNISKNLEKHYQGYLMEDSLSDDDYPTCASVMLCGEQNLDISSGEESESSHLREKLDNSNLDVNGLEIGGCWIDDIACVETVIAEENNNNKSPESEDSREMWKVSGGKKYFSSFVDYNKESNDILKDSNSNVISEFDERLEYDESKQQSELSNYSFSPKSEGGYNTDSQVIESPDLKSNKNDQSEDSLNDSYKRIYAELESQFGPPETKSESKIKNRHKSESDPRRKSPIKKSSRSSSVSDASIYSCKIKTKGAKKYIPPIEDSHKKLKCHLPLPEDMLLSLKRTNSLPDQEDRKINRSANRMVLPKKPPKPLFEDVLKNIDRTQISLLQKKLKKTKNFKKAIPKMIIRKNEQGSHYASVSKKGVQKSKTDEWQPQVCLERSACIEDLIKDKNVIC